MPTKLSTQMWNIMPSAFCNSWKPCLFLLPCFQLLWLQRKFFKIFHVIVAIMGPRMLEWSGIFRVFCVFSSPEKWKCFGQIYRRQILPDSHSPTGIHTLVWGQLFLFITGTGNRNAGCDGGAVQRVCVENQVSDGNGKVGQLNGHQVLAVLAPKKRMLREK